MGALSGLPVLRRSTSEGRVTFRAAPVEATRTAALNGDWERLQSLLAEYPGLITTLYAGQESLLGLAAAAGRSESVRVLLSNAERVPGGVETLLNHRRDDGDTPLLLAASQGHLDVVRLGLHHLGTGLNMLVDQRNAIGETLLHVAANFGHADVVRLLLHHPGTDVNALFNERNDRGDTPLLLAAFNGHLDVVRLGLQHLGTGMNMLVDQRNAIGDTLLHVAAGFGHADVVRLLLQHPGTDVNALVNERNERGDTPLILAVSNGHLDVVRLGLQHLGTGINMLVNQRNAVGDTLLHVAAGFGYADVVRLLLQHPGTDVNALINERNDLGDTALHLAVDQRNVQLVRLLLSHDEIDLTQHNGGGLPALHLAVFMGNVEMVSAIAEHPACDCDAANGMTPLHVAVELNRHDAIEAMLQTEWIDANRQGGMPGTPLSLAVHFFTEYCEQGEFSAVTDPKRIRGVLKVLARYSDKVDFSGPIEGKPALAALCQMRPRANPRGYDKPTEVERALSILIGDMLAASPQDDLQASLALWEAATAGHWQVVHTLLQDPRTDPNALSTWMIEDPRRAFSVLNKVRMRDVLPSESDIDRFVVQTLSEWAKLRAPHAPYVANSALGEYLKNAVVAGSSTSATCSKEPLFYFSLALEQALAARDFASLSEYSAQVLSVAPPHMRFFNVNGVDVSRTDLETWAAGRLPEGFVNMSIEANTADGGIDSHVDGVLVQARNLIEEIKCRLAPEQQLSVDATINAIKAAMDTAQFSPDEQEAMRSGLAHALSEDGHVAEGLNTNVLDTNVREALSMMWSHIAASPQPLRQNLTEALLFGLKDIDKESPCNTGCVTRIVFCGQGIDLSLYPSEPTTHIIADQINELAAHINNRFEELYGDSATDPGTLNEDGTGKSVIPAVQRLRNAISGFLAPRSKDVPSSSAAGTLSPAERKLIARYQDGNDIDEDVVLKVKQDMLEAAVMADLVDRRGWSASKVKPQLERIKEFMKYT